MSNVTTRPDGAVLLTLGGFAGVVFTVVGAVQAFTRKGFDISRHATSLLSNGDLGWIQIVNFIGTGLLLTAGAVGLRRALSTSAMGMTGAMWSPRLLGVYGASLIAAGVFLADPTLGFPPGTPDVPAPLSWPGLVHFAAGGVGFACFVVACFVLARRFTRQGQRGWAIWSRVTGAVFLAAFAGIASGSGGPASLYFVIAVLLAWIWLTAVFLKIRRETRTRAAGS